LSYLGDIPELRLRLDIRAFHEHISGLMRLDKVNGSGVAVVSNGPDMTEKGIEYQADWRPLPGTRVLLAQTFLRIQSPHMDSVLAAPTYNTSIGWFQDLPADFQLSVMRYSWGAMTWQGTNSRLDATVRSDLRLAHSFRTAGSHGEVALTIQNLNDSYLDFSKAFLFERRTFASVRLDF
jgi:iron complex outermembrane receptor protein